MVMSARYGVDMHGRSITTLFVSVIVLVGACTVRLHASESATALLEPRLRIVEPALYALVQEGVARSSELRRLVAALADSDLLVYVLTDDCHPRAEACLMLTFANAHVRYVRIHVPVAATAAERLAYLGHELRHALEIAARPDVRTDRQMEQLYRQIGVKGCGGLPRCYDTAAARSAGVRVLRELQAPGRRVSH